MSFGEGVVMLPDHNQATQQFHHSQKFSLVLLWFSSSPTSARGARDLFSEVLPFLEMELDGLNFSNPFLEFEISLDCSFLLLLHTCHMTLGK